MKMLEAFIIDKLRKEREKREELTLELPLPEIKIEKRDDGVRDKSQVVVIEL